MSDQTITGNLTVEGTITTTGGLNVANLHSDALNIPSVSTTSNSTLYVSILDGTDNFQPLKSDKLTFNPSSGELTVTSLKVTGTATTISTTNLNIKDNEIVLNSGEASGVVSAGTAGLAVQRDVNLSNSARIRWEEADQTWRLGLDGSLQPIATRNADMSSSFIAIWDQTNRTFKPLSAGKGISGQALVSQGTDEPIWTSGVAAATASAISGGAAGKILYQSGANSTSFSTAGTTGQILQSNGSGAPTWINQSSISVSSAPKLTTARNIAGVAFDGSADISIPFANLSSKPTTVAGYGITDAASTSHTHTSSNITDATAAATANMIAKRDSSGNMYSTGFGVNTGNLSGYNFYVNGTGRFTGALYDKNGMEIIGGSKMKMSTFTSSGTFTASSYFATIILIGGGGAGGGALGYTGEGRGGGGGAGCVRRFGVALTLGTGYTVTIGSGGTGVSNAAGNPGGNTSIVIGGTTYYAYGGGGGGRGYASSSECSGTGGGGGSGGTGGAGGTGGLGSDTSGTAGTAGAKSSYGDGGFTGGVPAGAGSRQAGVSQTSGAGCTSADVDFFEVVKSQYTLAAGTRSGNGGNAFGYGGLGATSSGNGSAGSGYGCGGGGANSINSTSYTGGAGTQGICIILEQ